MNEKPLDAARRLYDVAVPIFLTLKEEVRRPQPASRSRTGAGNLTFTQLRILLAIEYGQDQVGKLARSARVAQPAMSKLVDHLIGLRLLRREPHPADRRQIKLCLTAKGAALTERVRLRAAARYADAIQDLSAADKKKLTDGVAVICRVIETTKKENR